MMAICGQRFRKGAYDHTCRLHHLDFSEQAGRDRKLEMEAAGTLGSGCKWSEMLRKRRTAELQLGAEFTSSKMVVLKNHRLWHRPVWHLRFVFAALVFALAAIDLSNFSVVATRFLSKAASASISSCNGHGYLSAKLTRLRLH